MKRRQRDQVSFIEKRRKIAHNLQNFLVQRKYRHEKYEDDQNISIKWIVKAIINSNVA